MISGGSSRVCCHFVRRAAGRVWMRCGECAAEVAVTAGVCSRCGAPIVWQQPPVVADTVVADTVVGAVTHRPREGHEGWNVAGVVLAVCLRAGRDFLHRRRGGAD